MNWPLAFTIVGCVWAVAFVVAGVIDRHFSLFIDRLEGEIENLRYQVKELRATK